MLRVVFSLFPRFRLKNRMTKSHRFVVFVYLSRGLFNVKKYEIALKTLKWFEAVVQLLTESALGLFHPMMFHSVCSTFLLYQFRGKCRFLQKKFNSIHYSGQSYKGSMFVNYNSRVIIWDIFKSGTTLEP